jgi:hypothetical protein
MNYIANVADNRQLYRKAYLIEFKNGNNTEDVFTFSLPPESEELSYTQRKSETKTFGGLHIDEYGIDAAKIVLSGSTVNQELKMIYRRPKDSKWLTGEEEIYYFRDLIQKYKSLDMLAGPDNRERTIMIYDLSKTYMNMGVNTRNNIKNYWQAFPGDFKIRRSNDKPFTYKYSFEFTGVAVENFGVYASRGEPPELKPAKLDILQSVMSGLIAALDFVDGINAKINNVLDKINQVRNLLTTLGNVMSYSANTLSGIIDSAGDAAAGLIGGATGVVNGVNSVVSLPRTVQLKALNAGLEIQNAANALMTATSDLVKNCRESTGEDAEIPREAFDEYAMNDKEFKDSVNTLLDRAENTANELAAAAKSSVIPDIILGNPDPVTGEQRIILSYGNTSIMIKDTDTLESLANKHLGDPDKAIDIAAYNGIAALSDLKPGDVIRLPVTTVTRNIANNRVYARREDRDNYGRDIQLTEDGFIVLSESGDYKLTSGVHTLTQAVLLRLRESVEKRIRVNAYGIRTNISDPTAGVAYIISSIELTVLGDPRVSAIENIRFSSAGDHLNVDVDYRDISGASGNAAGRA